ncbi:hypothetical protein EN806_53170 [bacterium M00.F.Ca.ET.163.01.1.1]|nr:hypothetical protein EN806_53170 [bacterium M00.F.Ca.ET.163.01.1.1]
MSTPDANGWIAWGGGKCPLPADALIQFQVKGESKVEAEMWPFVRAGECRWDHRGIMYWDLVAYRGKPLREEARRQAP